MIGMVVSSILTNAILGNYKNNLKSLTVDLCLGATLCGTGIFLIVKYIPGVGQILAGIACVGSLGYTGLNIYNNKNLARCKKWKKIGK
jgi:hypothetical protein